MKKTLLALAISTVSITCASAQDLTINFTNLTHGSHFTPLLFGAHSADQHLFQIATNASDSLQAMAEGGSISALVDDLTALNADVISNPPPGGPTEPGQTVTFDLTTQALNTHLSMTAMILPSNDGFVGLDALAIPTTVGTYTYYLNAYDAGTEANDEVFAGMAGGTPGAAGFPADPLGRQGANATGVSNTENNATVHIHRGVIGDADPMGGASDIDSRIHRWLNPVARLVIEVK